MNFNWGSRKKHKFNEWSRIKSLRPLRKPSRPPMRKKDTDYTNFHRLKPCVFTLKSRDFFAFSLNLICPYLPYMVQKTPAI